MPEPEDFATLGHVIWHQSEKGGGPDVGLSIGLGDGATLWVGEISDVQHAEGGPEAAALGDDFGWWAMLYPDAALVAKFVNAEIARAFFDKISGAVFQAQRAAMAERDTAVAEAERLAKLVYVPGMFKCAKCSCVTIRANLHADTGRLSANNDPADCPNGCGPAWRVTERDAGNEMIARADAAASSLEVALAERDKLREALEFIAKQQTSGEMAKAELATADFEGAYNEIVELALGTLYEPKGEAMPR